MDLQKKVVQAGGEGLISQETVERLSEWLTAPQYQESLLDLSDLVIKENWDELENAFSSNLEVGTAGIRGKIGPGINRINFYTISKVAQGLSDFIKSQGVEAVSKGVVVGYDVRKFSKEFAQRTCQVFAANGIKSKIFKDVVATPQISFAIRDLGVAAGVMITASHNPKTDNGFKFYWSDGGQVVAPHDKIFTNLVNKVVTVNRLSFDAMEEANLVDWLENSVVLRRYVEKVSGLSLIESRSAKIAFSPLHGVGTSNVLPVLKDGAFDVAEFDDQMQHDPSFSSIVGNSLNPEFLEVAQPTIEFAESIGADVAIISDPDADRVGVAAKKTIGEDVMIFLNGHQIGAAMLYFLLSQQKNILTPEHLVLKTYVTTGLIEDIAKEFGVRIIGNLPVGFKFISEKIEKMDDKGKFIFGAEESLGFLRGSFVREKDAAISALTIAEMCSWLKDQGKTLNDYLNEIYSHFGYYKNRTFYYEITGTKGLEDSRALMMHLQKFPPVEISGLKVFAIKNDINNQITYLLSEDGRNRITVRPSGTEPKIKYYTEIYSPVQGDNLDSVKEKVDNLSEKVEAELLAYGGKNNV